MELFGTIRSDIHLILHEILFDTRLIWIESHHFDFLPTSFMHRYDSIQISLLGCKYFLFSDLEHFLLLRF